MQDLFLPTLHTFENENIWNGSYQNVRFRVTPSVTMLDAHEVNNAASSMKVEYWTGQFCYEKSTMEDEAVFPLTEDGLEAMRQWIKEKNQKIIDAQQQD